MFLSKIERAAKEPTRLSYVAANGSCYLIYCFKRLESEQASEPFELKTFIIKLYVVFDRLFVTYKNKNNIF